METVLLQAIKEPKETTVVKKRGRPARMSNQLLAAGVVWCVLHGWVSQWDLWRRISCFGVGSLEAVAVCDQAIYNRLAKHAMVVMEHLCAQISTWLWHWMAPYEDHRLAPFACQILALDESTMDAVHRWLKDHLGLRFPWSAKMQVIGAQVWATVLLAQILHALQVQVAVESGVETIDVSLELLWRYLPELSQRPTKLGKPLLQVIKEVGVALKLIRPSTRLTRNVPTLDWREISLPPVDLLWIRPPRYAHKASAPGSGSHSHTRPKKRTRRDLVGVGGACLRPPAWGGLALTVQDAEAAKVPSAPGESQQTL